MSLNAKKVAGGNSDSKFKRAEPLEPGTYPARVVNIIDLGVQPQRPFRDTPKPPCQEIRLVYELTDEFLKDEEGNDIEDKPRLVFEEIPLLNLKAERAKSTQRYKALDPNEDFDGDFTQLIGLPCNVTLTKSPDKKNPEIVYNNVAGITTMREKDAKRTPELVNPPKVFLLDEPDLEIFNSLYEKLQNKIRSNLNFQGSKLQSLLVNSDAGSVDKEEAEEEAPKKAPAKKATPKLAESSEKPAWEDSDEDSPY